MDVWYTNIRPDGFDRIVMMKGLEMGLDSSSGSLTGRPKRSRMRLITALFAAVVLAAVNAAVTAPANAYTTTGCKWPTGNLGVRNTLGAGTTRDALTAALNNYTVGTDVNLTQTSNNNEPFRTESYNYGATGWEGQSSWGCTAGITYSNLAKLNSYYLSTAPEGQKRVVWLHELGHGLGLGHVTTVARVMYTSASSAYGAGVRNLTSDEVAGINALY